MLTEQKKRAEREHAVKLAYAINEIKGVPISEAVKAIHRQWIDGKIDDEQMKAMCLQYCKGHYGSNTD